MLVSRGAGSRVGDSDWGLGWLAGGLAGWRAAWGAMELVGSESVCVEAGQASVQGVCLSGYPAEF